MTTATIIDSTVTAAPVAPIVLKKNEPVLLEVAEFAQRLRNDNVSSSLIEAFSTHVLSTGGIQNTEEVFNLQFSSFINRPIY